MGLFQDNLCVILICIAFIIGLAVMVKVIRDRRATKRSQRPKKRNSLQKYPSFVGNRIYGVYTILPPVQFYNKDSRRLSEQYIIAVGPPIDFYDSSLGFYERLYPYPGRAIRRQSAMTPSSEYELDLNNNNNTIQDVMEQQIDCEEEADENNNHVITMKIHDNNNHTTYNGS